MTFRADEEKEDGFARALRYLTENLSSDQKKSAEEWLTETVEEFGPVVELYPVWHPLVCDEGTRLSYPHGSQGYERIDHTICFVNAFVTCPYKDSNRVVASVKKRSEKINHPYATLEAEAQDLVLYHEKAQPVLVWCRWHTGEGENIITQRDAICCMIEHEIPMMRSAQVGESWKTMESDFLGSPHGRRSSLFVNEEVGMTMKRVWNAMLDSGVFGPALED